MANMTHRFALLLIAVLASPPAAALGLPLPGLPRPVDDVVQPVLGDATRLADERVARVRSLLRAHPRALARDPRGELVVRGELLAIEPGPEALAAAGSLGLRVREQRELAPLGLRVVVFEAPPRRSLRRLLRELREADPAGHFDYNHVYLGAGAIDAAPAETLPATGGEPARIVGLVDGGVDAGVAAADARRLQRHGCPEAPADPHGSAVARLLLEEPRVQLRAADIYCGQSTGGSVLRLAEAMAWLASERATVVNLSLVGPENALLGRLVESMQARGHVLVAAVGNDGPAAAPLYPAAYPGVIGVAAVDARGRALPESGRGAHVDFAALGLFEAADAAGKPRRWRGTSFAAPRVARRAALAVDAPGPDALATAMRTLAAEAADAAPAGRDPATGEGVVGPTR